MKFSSKYDYIIVNDDLDTAVNQLTHIVRTVRKKAAAGRDTQEA